MDKYLIQILKEVNTIIIPDFGALTIVNQATGEVMFMSFMKFDDGKLIQHIAEKENWEENEARNLVAKYVREINTKLDQGDTYDMYQFGSFTKNGDGEVEFIPMQSEVVKSDVIEEKDTTDSKSAPIVTKVDEKIEEPIIEKIEELKQQKEVILPVKEVQVNKIEQEVIELKESINEAKIPEVKPIEVVKKEIIEEKKNIEELKVQKPIVLSVEEQMKDDLDLPPINDKKEIKKKPILEKTKKDKVKKKRGAGFYILLVLLAILIGGGTFFGVNYGKYKQYIPFLATNKPTEKTVTPEKDPAVETQEENTKPLEETVTEEEVSLPEIESKVITNSEKGSTEIITQNNSDLSIDKTQSIQVIAGSFTELSNAERMVAKLKKSGVNAEVVGLIDGLNIVSIGSFSNMSEMNSSLDKVKSTGLKYWVYKK